VVKVTELCGSACLFKTTTVVKSFKSFYWKLFETRVEQLLEVKAFDARRKQQMFWLVAKVT